MLRTAILLPKSPSGRPPAWTHPLHGLAPSLPPPCPQRWPWLWRAVPPCCCRRALAAFPTLSPLIGLRCPLLLPVSKLLMANRLSSLPPSSFSARGGRWWPWLRMNSSICLAHGACDHCRYRLAHHFFRPLSTPILLCKVSTSGVWQGRTSCLAQYLFQTFWALRAWPKTPGRRGEKHIGHPLPLHAFSLFAALCA